MKMAPLLFGNSEVALGINTVPLGQRIRAHAWQQTADHIVGQFPV